MSGFDFPIPMVTGFLGGTGTLALSDSGQVVAWIRNPETQAVLERVVRPGSNTVKILSLDEAEDPWTAIRERRNSLLDASDSTQAADRPMAAADLDAWRVYRTALRDIPAQADPASVVWPTPPE